MANHRENVVFTMLKIKNTNEDLRDVVAQVNSDLNTAKKRFQGLLVLQHFLGQCSTEMFSSNFHTWLNLLLQILQGYASPEQHQVALNIMSTMIEKVTAFPELSRDMGTNKVKTILPVLLSLKSKQKTKEAVAACISSCIVHFPGPTSFFKSKIEAMVVEELDNPFPPQVYIRCYTLLARCGMGSHRDKQREAWQAQYEKILSALKSVLTKLYAGLESGEEDGDDDFFVLPIPNVQPDQTNCLVGRFCTLCACLGTLLREPFPTWVRLNLSGILQLICRTLAVQTDMLKAKGSTDHMLLLTYLPLMYSSVFTLLTHLIVCGKMLLVGSGDMVVSLCVQCLASMSVSKAGFMSSYRKVRQQVYQTLQTWLQVAGTSAMTNFATDETLKDLLVQIFTDISPQQPEALLLEKSSQKTDSKPPPKKKRRKNQSHQELSVNVRTFLPDTEDLVTAGLKTLTQLIKSSAIFMEEKLFKSLKDRVCSLVNEVQRTPLPPYTSPRCCQALYTALMVSVTCPTPDPCHLQYAVTLFQRGMVDTQFVVAKTCCEALALCQNLIHPRTPCLLAPVTRPACLGDAFDIVDHSTSAVACPATFNATPSHNTPHDNNTVSTIAEPSSSVPSSDKLPQIPQRTSVSSCDSDQNQPRESESDCTEDSEESFPSAVKSEGVAGPSVDSSVIKVKGAEASFSDGAGVEEKRTEVLGVDKEDLATLSATAEEEHAGTSFADRLPEESLMETETNAGVSAMLSSFVPCGADPDDDNISDSD